MENTYAMDWFPKYDSPITGVSGDIRDIKFKSFDIDSVQCIVMEFAIYNNGLWCNPDFWIHNEYAFYKAALNYTTMFLPIVNINSVRNKNEQTYETK